MNDKLREAAEGMVTLADMDGIPAPNACVWFNAFDRRIATLRAALASTNSGEVVNKSVVDTNEPRPDAPGGPWTAPELLREAESLFDALEDAFGQEPKDVTMWRERAQRFWTA